MRVPLAVLLLTFLALAGCTSEPDQDSDGDGLTDSEERQGWQLLIVETMEGRFYIETASDLNKVDTDGDGLDDWDEFFLRTDPANPDSDGDGLTDCQEERHSVREECEDPDFDGPYDNGTGTHPMKADSDPGPSRYKDRFSFVDDTGTLGPNDILFGDGISDYDEWVGVQIDVAGGSRLVRPDPRSADTDGDGLEDGEELLEFHSDPTVFDTDGDGCQDGLDPLPTYEQVYRLVNITFENTGSSTELAMDIFVEGGQARIEAGEVSSGDTVDLGDVALTPSGCNRTPLAPHVDLVIVAYGDGSLLDITSASHPFGDPETRFSWDVRAGTLAWDDDEPPFARPLTVSGEDGVLRFDLATR